jgi:hypothetical protein
MNYELRVWNTDNMADKEFVQSVSSVCYNSKTCNSEFITHN